MPRKAYIFSFLCLLDSLAWGQSITLSSNVLDAEDEMPLEGAYVAIPGERGTYVGVAGQFVLNFEQAAPVTLLVKYLGYESLSLATTLITDQALRKVHPDNALYIKDKVLLFDDDPVQRLYAFDMAG